jgi:hypothetical protein
MPPQFFPTLWISFTVKSTWTQIDPLGPDTSCSGSTVWGVFEYNFPFWVRLVWQTHWQCRCWGKSWGRSLGWRRRRLRVKRIRGRQWGFPLWDMWCPLFDAPHSRRSLRISMSVYLGSCWGLVDPLQRVGFWYRAIKACMKDISDHLSFFYKTDLTVNGVVIKTPIFTPPFSLQLIFGSNCITIINQKFVF